MILRLGKKHFLLLTVISIPFLSSCTETLVFKAATTGLIATANDIFTRPEVNLREKNYAAADFLAQQMKENVDRNAVIFSQRLEEADNPGISSPLGVSIPREIGLRLSDLGYTVYVHDVQPFGSQGLNPTPKTGTRPDYILKGSYYKTSRQIDVKLRLINVKSGRTEAMFDYPLLLSREVREAIKTPTQIFQTQK